MARITSLGLFGTPWTASPLFGEDIPVGPQPTPPTTVKVFGWWGDPSGDGRVGEIATAKATETIYSGSYIIEVGQGEYDTLDDNGYFELLLSPGNYEFFITCDKVYNIRVPSNTEEIDIRELLGY